MLSSRSSEIFLLLFSLNLKATNLASSRIEIARATRLRTFLSYYWSLYCTVLCYFWPYRGTSLCTISDFNPQLFPSACLYVIKTFVTLALTCCKCLLHKRLASRINQYSSRFHVRSTTHQKLLRFRPPYLIWQNLISVCLSPFKIY